MKFSIFTGEKNLYILHGQVFVMLQYFRALFDRIIKIKKIFFFTSASSLLGEPTTYPIKFSFGLQLNVDNMSSRNFSFQNTNLIYLRSDVT